jgi:Mannosyltransferase putative
MSRGIYITANDRVLDQAIALLNSIRVHDSEIPVVLIPYDDNYQLVAARLQESFGVQVYKDLEFIDRLSKKLQQTFGDQFFARPNQFRKQACWFGDFDEFLYIDTDIVVFEKIADNLNYLAEYDFICSDYQHAGGITNVFSPQIIEAGVFDKNTLQDIFNCGFWGAKRHLLNEADLYATFAECAAHPEYFDFSQKTSDQPIINYMILKRVERRFNIVRRPGKAPGNWAGSKHFLRQGDGLIDPKLNQPLQYLHWAGFRIEPGCPYWDVWKHYRYLHEPAPEDVLPPSNAKSSLLQVIKKIRSRIKA